MTTSRRTWLQQQLTQTGLLRYGAPLLLCAPALAQTPAPQALRLWYRRPADEWTQALPVGNGRLGAKVARAMNDAPGWVAFHNTDGWRVAAPADGAKWGLWPMGRCR